MIFQKKKDDDEKKIINLQKQINALQASLSLESANRASSIQALQAWLKEEVVTRIENRAVCLYKQNHPLKPKLLSFYIYCSIN